MKNSEVLDLFDQTHSVRIDTLLWIAGMLWSRDLVDFFNENLDFGDFEDLFTWVADYDIIDEEDLVEMLVGTNKLGFLARISVPEHSRFVFDEAGEFKSCSIHEGIRHATFIYAESTEDLVSQIEARADSIYQRFVDKAKKEQGLTV